MSVKPRDLPQCYRRCISFHSVDPTWLFLRQNLFSDGWKKQHGFGIKIKGFLLRKIDCRCGMKARRAVGRASIFKKMC